MPTILDVLVYPDPVLRCMSEPVEVIDDALRSFAEDLILTMYEKDGVGLAAPQVGRSVRIIAVDASGGRDGAMVLLNPEVVERKGKHSESEGCLSLPGLRGEVQRPEAVVVEALDLLGQGVRIEAEGLLGRALQHEIDHLDGILFIDKVGKVERFRLRHAIQRLEDEYGAAH